MVYKVSEDALSGQSSVIPSNRLSNGVSYHVIVTAVERNSA